MSEGMESLGRCGRWIWANPLELHGARFPTGMKNAASRRGKGCQADNHNSYAPQKVFQSNLPSRTERQKEGRGHGWGANFGTWFFFISNFLFSSFLHLFPSTKLLACWKQQELGLQAYNITYEGFNRDVNKWRLDWLPENVILSQVWAVRKREITRGGRRGEEMSGRASLVAQ